MRGCMGGNKAGKGESPGGWGFRMDDEPGRQARFEVWIGGVMRDRSSFAYDELFDIVISCEETTAAICVKEEGDACL